MNSSSADTQQQQAGKVRDLLVTRNGRKERLSYQIVHLPLILLFSAGVQNNFGESGREASSFTDKDLVRKKAI